MDLFIIPIIIVSATIVIYFYWNYNNNRKNPNKRYRDDIRYYELKSKYEFLVAVASLFAIVLSYIGVTTKSNLESELRARIILELKPAKDSLLLFEKTLKDFEIKTKNYEGAIQNSTIQLDNLFEKQKQIDTKYTQSSTRLNSIKNRVKEIGESNALKKEFYILNDITIIDGSYKDNEGQRTYSFFFKDLETVKGDRLPKFNEPPFILVSAKNGGVLNITKITNTHFEGVLSSSSIWNGTEKNIFNFQLIIYN